MSQKLFRGLGSQTFLSVEIRLRLWANAVIAGVKSKAVMQTWFLKQLFAKYH